jgi:hypothetical protein
VRLEVLGQLKDPMTSSGIEPTTLVLAISNIVVRNVYTEIFHIVQDVSCAIFLVSFLSRIVKNEAEAYFETIVPV